MDKIIDGLYLGDIFSCSNKYMLKKSGITHILTMAAGMKPLYPKDFIYKCFDIYDLPTENLLPHLPDAIAFIKNAINMGGNILVHCYAGVSRSASTVIAYLMVEKGASFVNAVNYQLVQVEEILKKKNNDKISVISKSKKAIRSAKVDARSEVRSNHRSNQSAYRGKNSKKYKLRQSVKVPKENSSSRDKGYKTYKEKAKLYYSSMNYGTPQLIKFKNNWTGESKENIKHFEYTKDKEDEIKTSNKLSKEEIPSRAKQENKSKSSPQKSVLMSQRNQSLYKRINKDYYKDKIKDEKNRKAYELVTFSPNGKKASTIYENIKTQYDSIKETERKYSKSVIRT